MLETLEEPKQKVSGGDLVTTEAEPPQGPTLSIQQFLDFLEWKFLTPVEDGSVRVTKRGVQVRKKPRENVPQ